MSGAGTRSPRFTLSNGHGSFFSGIFVLCGVPRMWLECRCPSSALPPCSARHRRLPGRAATRLCGCDRPASYLRTHGRSRAAERHDGGHGPIAAIAKADTPLPEIRVHLGCAPPGLGMGLNDRHVVAAGDHRTGCGNRTFRSKVTTATLNIPQGSGGQIRSAMPATSRPDRPQAASARRRCWYGASAALSSDTPPRVSERLGAAPGAVRPARHVWAMDWRIR